MPGAGSFGTIGGYEVPSRYEVACRAGIRFFIVGYPNQRDQEPWDQILWGLYDVTVSEDFGATAGNPYNEHWHTAQDCNCLFHVQQASKQVVGFVPDDRFFHNRVFLSERPFLTILGMFIPDKGVISAGEAQVEIRSVFECLNETKTVYTVVEPGNGREVDFFNDEESAQKFIESEEVRAFGIHSIPTSIKPYKNCKIVLRKIFDKKPEIKVLIQKHRFDQFGWTNCEEFKQNWIPKIDAIVTEKKRLITKDSNVFADPVALEEMINAGVLKVLKTMPQEAIDALRAMPAPRSQTVGTETEQAIPAEQQKQAQSPSHPALALTKTQLSQGKKLVELQEIAKDLGIPFEGLKKDQLVDVIWAQKTSARAVEKF